MVMFLRGSVSCTGYESQASGHTEVQDQSARAAVEQEVFSTTHDRSDFQTRKRLLKVWHRPA